LSLGCGIPGEENEQGRFHFGKLEKEAKDADGGLEELDPEFDVVVSTVN